MVQADPPKQDSFLVNLGTSLTGSIDDNKNFVFSVVYYDNGERVGGSFSSKVVLKEQECTKVYTRYLSWAITRRETDVRVES